MKRQNAQRLDQIERQIAAIDPAILEIARADAGLVGHFAILTSVPGVSAVNAFALLIETPYARQAASLAGLAPPPANPAAGLHSRRPRQRPTAVYMPALVAMRFNPDLKEKYNHLIEAAKPAKVAEALAALPTRGPGVTHRIGCAIQRNYVIEARRETESGVGVPKHSRSAQREAREAR